MSSCNAVFFENSIFISTRSLSSLDIECIASIPFDKCEVVFNKLDKFQIPNLVECTSQDSLVEIMGKVFKCVIKIPESYFYKCCFKTLSFDKAIEKSIEHALQKINNNIYE